LKVIMSAFLQPGQTDNFVKILNPAQFEVWRQDSRPYQGNASMASLTPVELTRIITEVCLEALQEQGMTDRARCCIVYEEAHSLVPEWNSVADEGDKTACNGTAKAVLQGRKFGLGCIAVTQRTANITKSILNQCNTVFALRTFDATGVEFLRHYVGPDYAAVLSVLEDRHCVVFGRASSCKDPALIRLNERAEFLGAFR
jgi:DNA helicase HerA-like ATPase